MESKSSLGPTLTRHEMERTQRPPRSLHERMMLEAEPIIQHNWTDVAIHDKAKLKGIPVGHICYWVVTEMGSFLTPAYCKISERSKWTSDAISSLAPIQILVARRCGQAHKYASSKAWQRVYGFLDYWHCYLVVKTDATNGHLIPIPYLDLADLAVCKTRPMSVEMDA